MPRALFEKNGQAIYISHLDLMRLFQRAFKRAGLPLTHTQGYNPRPSVSIAMPLSLGMESQCELLDFDLEGERPSCDEIAARLNEALVEGVRVLKVFENGLKLKHLALLESELFLEYDHGIPEAAISQLKTLFTSPEVIVEKTNRNGTTQQNLVPMIRSLEFETVSSHELKLHLLACCQNPTLNPMQLITAIGKYLPELVPDFVHCKRLEIYDTNETVFR